MTEKGIHAICKKYNIINYTINTNMTIDVEGDVKLSKINDTFFDQSDSDIKSIMHFDDDSDDDDAFDIFVPTITQLPLRFNVVNGNFDCSNNMLTTLSGCPKEVLGSFTCEFNSLTSLEGGPRNVHGNYICQLNKLTTLFYVPQVVNGDFNCTENDLTIIDQLPDTIDGQFYCDHSNFDLVAFMRTRTINAIIAS